MSDPEEAPTVFYSWQSDLPKEVCRSFIEDAIKRALKRLCREPEISQDARLDRDTKGEPGSPDIVKAIEDKIERAKAFVGDVSLVARNVDDPDKWLPNASVTTETGFAFGQLGERRVVLPFNTAFGDVNDLPFDLRNRRILLYKLAPQLASEADDKWHRRRSEARESLVNGLVKALRTIFERGDSAPPPTVLERHAHLLERQRELEKRGDRALEESQKEALIRILSQYDGRVGPSLTIAPTLIVSAMHFDAEAERYARAIAECCRAARWRVKQFGFLNHGILGLALVITDLKKIPGEGTALLNAFEELGIACRTVPYAEVKGEIGVDLEQSPRVGVLLVGPKP